MGSIIFKVFEMSFNASLLILAVVVLRGVLKNAPKMIRCILWALVGIRLICPVTIESDWSVLPNFGSLVKPVESFRYSVVENGTYVHKEMKQFAFNSQIFGIHEAGMENLAHSLSGIWICGIIGMVVYAVVSYIKVYQRVKEAVQWKENIWLCDHIDTPFILGIVRPRIYVPSTLADTWLPYVVAHEKAHLKRHDHWWKPLGFALVCVYWFQPFVWIAYILLCKDIELACDEQVIKNMDVEERKAYSAALLECSIPKKNIATCPLAFGAVGVKVRISAVLEYRKSGILNTMIAVGVCMLVAAGFLTNPVGASALGDWEVVFADVD